MSFPAAALFLTALHAAAATYPIAQSLSNTAFFDAFDYPAETYDNTTNGDVYWATAQNTSLLYVNDAGRVVLKVDNTTVVSYDDKRYAPKLLSKTAYDIGTVWVMDAVHMPYGCSVWPALWTQGTDWPSNGEIDISEGINNRQNNMVALHTLGTLGTCTVNATSSMTGQITYDNCDNNQDSTSGCTVNDTNTDSYGAGFAAAGGGAYVAEFASDGIRVWFLTRDSIPASLNVSAQEIDTLTLGTPVALYSSDTCNIADLFGPQTLTIDITLCGDFAGVASLLAETCDALVDNATCYSTYVINDGSSTYANAYYEINYINVYSNTTSSSSDSNNTSPDGAVSATTTVTVTQGSGNGRSSSSTSSADPVGAISLGPSAGIWSGLGAVVLGALMVL